MRDGGLARPDAAAGTAALGRARRALHLAQGAPATGQLLLGQFDHAANHMPTDSAALACRQISPVTVLWRGDTDVVGNFVFELI